MHGEREVERECSWIFFIITVHCRTPVSFILLLPKYRRELNLESTKQDP